MSEPPHSLLADYRVTISLPVQWGDMDAMGHVNNVVFFRWFESARVAYLDRIAMETSNGDLGPILASVKCDYRRQLNFPDTVTIGARITRLGRTSLSMVHAVLSAEQQTIVAEGDSTVVVFDYKTNRPEPIPQRLRDLIGKIEGQTFPGG
ncbi:MAG: thioesterase family protein [Pirellulales bacterium]